MITTTAVDPHHVAIVQWSPQHPGDLEHAIAHAFTELGYRYTFFCYDAPIPHGVGLVFSFAPYNRLLQIPKQIAALPANRRPKFIHWNTEGLPDLRLPWPLMKTLSLLRSRLEQTMMPKNGHSSVVGEKITALVGSRLRRFRYVGDYLDAQRKGWLDGFADISAVYAQLFNQHGLPTTVAPFGSSPLWYADYGMERDIDVMWMGTRGTERRSQALDLVTGELRRRGANVLIFDNIENPFVFGEERIKLLNRTKITLNLLRTWYDENSLRICLTAPNRSLVVSEPLLPHVPQYEAGVHYVSAPIPQLADTIMHYLDQKQERERLVENAYHLVTTELTFRNSIHKMIQHLH